MHTQRHWQYKSVFIKVPMMGSQENRESKLDEQLNHHGSLGWELVTLHDIMGGQCAIFKKPK